MLTFCNKLSPLSAADVSAHSLVTLSYVDKLLQQITGVSKLLRQFVTSIVTFQLSTRLSEFFSWSVSCLREKKVTQSPSSMKSGCTYFTLLNFGKRPLANGLIKLCFECEYLKLWTAANFHEWLLLSRCSKASSTSSWPTISFVWSAFQNPCTARRKSFIRKMQRGNMDFRKSCSQHRQPKKVAKNLLIYTTKSILHWYVNWF